MLPDVVWPAEYHFYFSYSHKIGGPEKSRLYIKWPIRWSMSPHLMHVSELVDWDIDWCFVPKIEIHLDCFVWLCQIDMFPLKEFAKMVILIPRFDTYCLEWFLIVFHQIPFQSHQISKGVQRIFICGTSNDHISSHQSEFHFHSRPTNVI